MAVDEEGQTLLPATPWKSLFQHDTRTDAQEVQVAKQWKKSASFLGGPGVNRHQYRLEEVNQLTCDHRIVCRS